MSPYFIMVRNKIEKKMRKPLNALLSRKRNPASMLVYLLFSQGGISKKSRSLQYDLRLF